MYDSFHPQRPVTLAYFIRSAKLCTQTITPLRKLRANEGLLLLDVREHAEFEAGRVPGARLVARGHLGGGR